MAAKSEKEKTNFCVAASCSGKKSYKEAFEFAT